MGLIGWADAVNDFDGEVPTMKQKEAAEGSLSMFRQEDLLPEVISELTEDEIETLDQEQGAADAAVCSAIDSKYDQSASEQEDPCVLVLDDVISNDLCRESAIVEDASGTEDIIEEIPSRLPHKEPEESFFDQLIDCIRSLKLRDADGSGRCCDITHLELHEAEFMLKHAERCTSVDYYKVVREIHGVKRRILDLTDTPDLVSSDNLDTLMRLVEDRYEASFGEGLE